MIPFSAAGQILNKISKGKTPNVLYNFKEPISLTVSLIG